MLQGLQGGGSWAQEPGVGAMAVSKSQVYTIIMMMHATARDSLIQHPIAVLVGTTGCVRDRNMHRCQARQGDEKGRPSHWCRWTSFGCESAWNNAMDSGGETETESQRCAGFE